MRIYGRPLFRLPVGGSSSRYNKFQKLAKRILTQKKNERRNNRNVKMRVDTEH
jgi:hypothetical protein